MPDANGWITVGGGEGNSNKTWDFKTQPEITGIYTGSKDINTKDGNVSRLYMINVDGEPVTVWDKTALRTGMSEVPMGAEVHIAYLGQVKSTKNPTKTYHNFLVQHRAASAKAAEEKADTELPFLS
jgi:hypothetical protein